MKAVSAADVINEVAWYKEQAMMLQSKWVMSNFTLSTLLEDMKQGKISPAAAMQKVVDYEGMLLI